MSATPATRALDAAGVPYTLRPYHHDPDTTGYGDEAAAALGVDPRRIFKTLLVDLTSGSAELAVAVVPVAGHLGLKQFAAAVGAKKASLTDKALVARSTGYVLGGVSPLGQRNRLPTVIDETAQLWDSICVSAGKRGLQLEVAPADLKAVTGAEFADIAR